MMTHLFAAAVACVLGVSGGTIAAAPAGPGSERALEGPGAPTLLRCEYLVDPLGVDVARPRLSWVVNDPRRGAMQGAYRILVASSRGVLEAGRGDVWDSGKVESDRTAQVEYAGPGLASAQRVYWKVKTWDKGGGESAWSEAASWTMGLLRPGDWGGAAWIGLPAQRGAAVPAHNGFHSDFSDRADVEKWVTIELAAPERIDGVRLWPARPFDWSADVPGLMFPVRFRVEVADNAGFSGAKVVVDRTGADEPNPGERAAEYRFAPVEARWVRLTVTRLGKRDEGHFALALAELEVLGEDRVVSTGAKAGASGAVTSNDWSKERLTDGILRSQRGKPAWRGPAVMVRTEFDAGAAAPARATLFATARGVYEFRINGRRVGDQELAPEWTDYRTRIQYQGYDVTPLVRAGGNAIGATVADGWYAGKLGLFRNEMYGDQLSVLAVLRLEFADGTTKLITTSPAWKGTLEGPVRAADLLDGETHDARRELAGWDAPGYGAGSPVWGPVQAAEAPRAALVAQPNEPIRVTGEIKPVSITEPAPGVVVVDFGQNMPGWVRAEVSGDAGAEVVFRYGEVLDERGRLYTANLRGAKQADTLVLSSNQDVLEPRFTYHGFRYVEVTGLPAQGGRAWIKGIVAKVVHSDAPEAGTFECSNPMLNRLMSNIRWTQYANMMSVPTDCPQRDERLGWMGDAQIFAQTAVFNLDMAAFFSKWAQDIRDAQGPTGAYPDFAPIPIGTGGKFMSVPGWGDAGVTVPWCTAINYDDRRLMEAQYESAKRWVDYIRANNPGLIWEKARGNDYGDWLNGDTLRLEGFPAKGGEVPKEIFATVNFENSCRLVSRMAAAIGKREESEQYRALADRIREAFCARFVGADGKMPGDTQAGYALALWYDLAPEALRGRMVSHLLAAIDRYGGHLSTGFHSTVPMMDELVRAGHADVAYRLVTSTEFPGWGFMIENGATSMWERWDGYVKGRAERGGFQDPGMNSFNHFAFGAIGEWMYRVIGGIRPDPEEPGWRHFFVRPVPGGGLTWAKAGYRSIRGEIAAAWKLEGDRILLNVTVPANTWATVDVPTADIGSVMEGGAPVGSAAGVTVGGPVDGALRLSVRAGRYEFSARAK
jgi:alpha-L-rhamnosidase